MWRYHNPVRVVFGAGAFDDLPTHIGSRAWGLVTYSDSYFRQLAARLKNMAGAPAVVIDDVAANPDYALLEDQCARIARAGEPEVWVALGGGSVIDSTKVFAAANGNFANVRTFLETGTGVDALSATPIIAVPTTAGTGSEVTSWATVWDAGSARKYSLARPGLYPEVALVDPALMAGKPRDLTVSTGLDALSHALESLWNVNANPVSAAFAVQAAREVLETLPLLARDLANIELRTRMARASLFAGFAFSNTKTAIAHSISYPITLRHNVPHGIACSFTLPLVIRSVSGRSDLCDSSLRQIFGKGLDKASEQLAKFLDSLGVTTIPADYGVGPEEWMAIVTDAVGGERGLNFIGETQRLFKEALALGASTASTDSAMAPRAVRQGA
ncbi:MAG: iron-containing alcohol dehydrogenase PsrA [Hyphomicrobiales bacterium]